MRDFVDRMARVLRAHGDGAPRPHGFGPTAPARRTSRVLVVLVAALVVAVPVGLAALQGGAVPPETAARRPSTAPRPPASGYVAAPDGWRWETGNGLQALVPDTWGYGVDLGSPCNRQVSPGLPGAVEVPGTHTLVDCPGPEPRSRYMSFLSFGRLDPKAPARNGRWVTEEVPVGSGVVTVRSDDPAVLRRILRSVSVVRGTDHNGCPLVSPFAPDGHARPNPLRGTDGETPDVVSICRYGGLDRPTGRLAFSTVLSDPRAVDVVAALRRAPRTRAFGGFRCLGTRGPRTVVVRARFPQGWQDYRVQADSCLPLWTDDGRVLRRLTRPVARAVLIGDRGPVDIALGNVAGNWLRDNVR